MLPLSLALATPLLLLSGLVQDRTARGILVACVWGVAAGLLGNLTLTAMLARPGVQYGEFSILVAPSIEELLKAFPLLVAALISRFSLKAEHMAGYGVASGIGFALLENARLLIGAAPSGAGDPMVQVIMRGLTTTIMHGLVTGLIGGTVYLLCNDRVDVHLRPLLLLQVWGVATVLHALFNLFVVEAAFGPVLAILFSLSAYGVTALVAYRMGVRRRGGANGAAAGSRDAQLEHATDTV